MNDALRRGEYVRFVTLTDATGQLDVAEWTRAWKRLSLRLSTPRKGRKARNEKGRLVWKERRRPKYLDAAAVAIEAHSSGSLHAHALLLGRYIPQGWLSAQARAVGLGRITYITALNPSQATSCDIANYLVPDATAWEDPLRKMTMAAYLTAKKHGFDAVAARSKQRVRPLRFSRNWPARPGDGGPLTKAHEDLIELLYADQDEDDGPFEVWNETELSDELAFARRRALARAAVFEAA